MIVMVVYTMCITLHLAISDITFGTNCLQSSVQMLFSIINLPNWDLAQMQIVISLVGLISVLACVYCTFFLSAKCKDTLTVWETNPLVKLGEKLMQEHAMLDFHKIVLDTDSRERLLKR